MTHRKRPRDLNQWGHIHSGFLFWNPREWPLSKSRVARFAHNGPVPWASETESRNDAFVPRSGLRRLSSR